MVDVIRLGAPPTGGDDVIRLGKAPKKKKSFKAKAEFILGTAAAVEAAFLTALLTKSPKATFTAFTATGLALGLAKTSPKTRKFVKEKIFNPLGAGEFIGTQIEKGIPKDKKPFKERVKEGAATAGLIGAAAAAGVGAAVITKEVVERVRKARVPKVTIPEAVLPTLTPVAIDPPISTTVLEPLAPVEKPPEEPIPEPITATPTTIKNIFKPSVDISIKKTKRLINQQVNVN